MDDNALQWLVRRLWQLVTFLRGHLEDDAARRALAEELGLAGDVPAPAVGDPQDIDAIEAYLASDDPDTLAFLAVADSLVRVMDGLETFLTPLLSGSGSPQSARDALYVLVEFSAVELMRQEAPIIYALALALGFIDDKIATHELPSIGIERARGPLETEEDALRHGQFVHLIGIAVMWLLEFAENAGLLDLEYDALLGWDPPTDIFTTPLPDDVELADSISARAATLVVRRKIPDVAGAAALSSTWIVIPEDHRGPGLFLSLGGRLSFDDQLGDQRVRAEADLLEGLSLFMVPGATEVEGAAGAGMEIEYLRGELLDDRAGEPDGLRRPALAWPHRSGSRIEIGNFGGACVVRAGEVVAKLIFDRSALVLASDDADSFLASVFPAGGIRADFDLAFGFDFLEQRLFLGGSAKLELVIPIGKSLGPLTIFHVAIRAGVTEDDDSTFEITLHLSLSLKLFAVTGVADRVGYRTALRATSSGGRLGPFDVPEFEFVPPRGIGIKVGGSGVSGGGFLDLDADRNEYAGVLALEFRGLSLKVIGQIRTNLDSTPDFSLLLIGSVEGLRISLFAGGILTGIGVIFGMHRSLCVEALQKGVKNRTLDSVLFPPDPLANAPQLLEALSTVFPVETDQWILGVSLQTSWISRRIVRIEAALVFEFPSPFRIALLGQASLTLPARQSALARFNFDIVGIVDFDDRRVSIDSVLYQSRIGKFPVSGGLAVRARWGDEPEAAAALGGLHPRFPLPESFPRLGRLAVALGKKKNPRIRGLCYVGATASTFHFGLGAEIDVGAGGFSLQGDFSIDVLLQFRPLRFLGELDFDASVKFKGRTLAGLRVVGSLEGPGPWRARGKVRIKLLFIKVTKRFNEPWGDPGDERNNPLEVWESLRSALESPDSWKGQLPSGDAVRIALRSAPPDGVIEIHPLGALEVVQRVVPLGVEMDKFENAPIAGERRFDIKSATLNGVGLAPLPVREHFAAGQHIDIGEGDAAVSRPAFEKFEAGARLDASRVARGAGVTTNFAYEEFVLNESITRPRRRGGVYQIPAQAVAAGAEHGAMARGIGASSRRYAGPERPVRRVDGGYAAVSVEGLVEQALEGDPLPPAASYTEVHQAIERHVAAHPPSRGQVQIVRSHERRTP